MFSWATCSVSNWRESVPPRRYRRDVIGQLAMIALGALILGAPVSTPAIAQDSSAEADTVVLPNMRKVGERFVIDTTTITQRLSGSKVTQVWRHETVTEATAEEVTAFGYILDLDTLRYEIARDHRLPTGLAGRLADLREETPVKLAMTAAGAVDGIANLPDVLSVNHQSMLETAQFFDSLNMPRAASNAVDEILLELSDPAFVEQSILEAPQLYFSMAGSEQEPGATYYIDDAIDFPLFADPVPSRIYFGVREIDLEAKTVSYDWWQEPDQAIFRAQLGLLFRQFAKDDPTATGGPSDIDLSAFSYHAEAVLVYSLENGLPLSMDFVKEIAVPDRRTIETVQARTRFE
jgi:hypothetical protein